MKVSQLIKILEKYDGNLDVITEAYSDYHRINEECIYKVIAVDKGDYIMRHHRTMDKNLNVKDFLYIGF